MGDATRRLFIGIPISKEDCPKFFSWVKNFHELAQQDQWDVRWTNPGNYHITVHFLGDSPHHPIEKIIQTLRQHVFPSFWIQIQDLGFFQKGKHSSVLWAGMQSKDIHALHEKIKGLMSELGYTAPTRPFNPHITLGRFKQLNKESYEHGIDTALDQFKVTKICLYESILTLQNIEHKILESFPCT